MRRITAVLALLCAALVTLAVPTTVQASTSATEPEMIARAIGTQTTGPSGFAAPNNVMPWGIDRIDSRTGRDNRFTYTTDGTGVKVYVIDSGVNATHLQFSSRVLSGWSYRANSAAVTSYNNANTAYNSNPARGIAPCAYKPSVHQFDPSTFDGVGDVTDVGKVDNDGHGTHVAGIVGGLSTGVAKAVTLVPVRVLDSCGAGTETMVLNGLNWILADHQLGEKAVVNMSIGFDSTATGIDVAIKNLLAEGIVVVAASGNDGKSACETTPAGTQGTISVGASTYNDLEPSFTNFGECVDIFAPGQSIVSTWPSSPDMYVRESGTSMAAPHVAGAAARFLQSATVTPTTPTDVWNWLKTNATCNAITYYKSSATDTSRVGLAKTPNRLLAVDAPAAVPCAPNNVTATVASKSSVVSWEEVAADNGSAVTSYTAIASPGGRTCSITSGTTCTITGLVNNTPHSISVVANNAIGAGASSTAVTVLPIGIPGAVAAVVATAQKNALNVSWTQTEGDAVGITYVATASPGGGTCSSTEIVMTSCTISGLINGAQYTVSVVGINVYGTGIATTLQSAARPGFTVKKSVVKKGSITSLSWLVSSISTGAKKWGESGPCSIVGTKLKTPKGTTSCVVVLKVAKTKKYPAMSTRVRIAVE
ncbi:MAG: S8 family serine peptidase [Ilumatobacteraceae bacterium]|nr:S8 family serine peptidase [Ilumatobacteraceae bacterium]